MKYFFCFTFALGWVLGGPYFATASTQVMPNPTFASWSGADPAAPDQWQTSLDGANPLSEWNLFSTTTCETSSTCADFQLNAPDDGNLGMMTATTTYTVDGMYEPQIDYRMPIPTSLEVSQPEVCLFATRNANTIADFFAPSAGMFIWDYASSTWADMTDPGFAFDNVFVCHRITIAEAGGGWHTFKWTDTTSTLPTDRTNFGTDPITFGVLVQTPGGLDSWDLLLQNYLTYESDPAHVVIHKTVTNSHGGTAVPSDFAPFYLQAITTTAQRVTTTLDVTTTIHLGNWQAFDTPLPGYSSTGATGDCDSSGAMNFTTSTQTLVCTLNNADAGGNDPWLANFDNFITNYYTVIVKLAAAFLVISTIFGIVEVMRRLRPFFKRL